VTSSSTMEAFAAAGGLDLDRLVAIFSFPSWKTLLVVLQLSLLVFILLCLGGGCQQLRLLSEGFLFCFHWPILHALLEWVVSGKAALSDSIPYLGILKWGACLDHVDSSHVIGFALLFSKTYWTLVFRNSIPWSNESGSACNPGGQASTSSKIGLQCRLKSLQISFGNMLLLKSRSGQIGAAQFHHSAPWQ
jgi:hypothetical protein